jgi:N-acetylmuramoyl-L-alanine amidase
MIDHLSPNFSKRPPGFDVDILMFHYTGMTSCEAALERLCDPESKVSAHYVIDEDGTVYSLVPEDAVAWHAGVSCWEGKIGMNQRSIGIELVNPGHEHGYRAFPKAQMDAAIDLAKGILDRHPIPPRQVLAHSDVAPMRRQDPGELFDWKVLADAGIGLWPKQTEVPPIKGAIHDIQVALRTIGYCIPVDGEDNEIYRAMVETFQRHWRPKKADGKADKETRIMLAAVSVAVQAEMMSQRAATASASD